MRKEAIAGTRFLQIIAIVLLVFSGALVIAKWYRTAVLADAKISYWGDEKPPFAITLNELNEVDLGNLEKDINPSGGIPKPHIHWRFSDSDPDSRRKLLRQERWHSDWDIHPNGEYAFAEIERIEAKDFRQIRGRIVLEDGNPIPAPITDRSKRKHYWALDVGSEQIFDGLIDRIDDIAWLNTVSLGVAVGFFWLFGRRGASASESIPESTANAEKKRVEKSGSRRDARAFGAIPGFAWLLFLFVSLIYVSLLMGKFWLDPEKQAGILHGYFWTHQNSFTKTHIPEIYWTQVADAVMFGVMAISGAIFYVWAWSDWRNLWDAIPDKSHLRLLHFFLYLGSLGLALSTVVYIFYVGATHVSSTERSVNFTGFSDYILHAGLVWVPFSLFSVFTIFRAKSSSHLELIVLRSDLLSSVKIPFWIKIEASERSIGFGLPDDITRHRTEG